MSETAKGSDLTLLEPIFDGLEDPAHALVGVLQRAQELYGHLPQDVLAAIADRLGLSLAKVIGVATFYSQFRLRPVGKHLILLCKGTACHVNGADSIAAALKEELAVDDGETTADGLFTLKCVACLGCCSLSPVMMIDSTTYGSLTSAKAKEIVRRLKAEG